MHGTHFYWKAKQKHNRRIIEIGHSHLSFLKDSPFSFPASKCINISTFGCAWSPGIMSTDSLGFPHTVLLKDKWRWSSLLSIVESAWITGSTSGSLITRETVLERAQCWSLSLFGGLQKPKHVVLGNLAPDVPSTHSVILWNVPVSVGVGCGPIISVLS